jgi:hypothetical protein
MTTKRNVPPIQITRVPKHYDDDIRNMTPIQRAQVFCWDWLHNIERERLACSPEMFEQVLADLIVEQRKIARGES